MLLALLLALTQAPSPITVQINHDGFAPGDRARVHVEPAQDGYLVVLHADPYGRVRVLFPLDPTDDDFIRNGHWDYRTLRNESIRNDPLSGLLDIVQRMAGTGHFEYDAVTYVVERSRIASRYGYGGDYNDYGYPYHFGFGIGFGYPYGCGYFCSPSYDPFCYNTFWGWTPRCYGYGFGFGYTFFRPRPYIFYRPRPYVFGGVFLAGRTNPNYVIPRNRPRYVPTQPRPRDTSSGGGGGGGGRRH